MTILQSRFIDEAPRNRSNRARQPARDGQQNKTANTQYSELDAITPAELRERLQVLH
jgi:hypothetical protein